MIEDDRVLVVSGDERMLISGLPEIEDMPEPTKPGPGWCPLWDDLHAKGLTLADFDRLRKEMIVPVPDWLARSFRSPPTHAERQEDEYAAAIRAWLHEGGPYPMRHVE